MPISTTNPAAQVIQTARNIVATQNFSLRAALTGDAAADALAVAFNDVVALAQEQEAVCRGRVAEDQRELQRISRERQSIEDELREQQALYFSLVEQLPAGIFRKDAAGHYILVNSWFCKLRGRSREELLKKTPEQLAASGAECETEIRLLNQGTQHHQEIMQTGRAMEFEEQYEANDGVRHLHSIKSPVFGADGKVIGSQGILMDISQRKLAEAELNRERSLLRTLMEKSDDCIYFKDTESRFLRCTNNMSAMFKAKGVEELIGKRDSDFFSEEHARDAFEDEQRIMRTGETLAGKVEKETWSDGRITWALTTKTPFRNEAGEVIGTFGISKDITAIKIAEEKLNHLHQQLVDASRQAGMAEVATSVLHNVGNVLNSVNVSSSLISEKLRNSKISNLPKIAALLQSNENDLGNFLVNDVKGKQLPGYLANLATHLTQERDEILQEAGSLMSNIMHIKEIVAMQQNYAKTSGILETLKVTDLVDDAIRMNDGAMNRHHVTVVRDFNEVPAITTEKHKVLQILVNLIRNAKYACDDSGRDDKQITLRVANGDGRIKISVIDNGVGIPVENLTRIFNHGFTTRKEGHGFGLHSGALAAKELGGSLNVLSEGHLRGATFTLDLPLTKS